MSMLNLSVIVVILDIDVIKHFGLSAIGYNNRRVVHLKYASVTLVTTTQGSVYSCCL